MNWALRFLGVGGSNVPELGSACGVLECDGEPVLMIDCGHEALVAYIEQYGCMPRAVYITHAHMDHIGGMERLFSNAYFDARLRGTIRLYFHAALTPILQARLADYPEVIAEGGANFWDAFSVVPVSRGFWHAGLYFGVFPTRHHAPDSSFGLVLSGSFVWTGDTRPIPEVLSAVAVHDEPIAHDCALVGNPSHTGMDDLVREYNTDMQKRLVLYHYGSPADADVMQAAGYRVAQRGDVIELGPPLRMIESGDV